MAKGSRGLRGSGSRTFFACPPYLALVFAMHKIVARTCHPSEGVRIGDADCSARSTNDCFPLEYFHGFRDGCPSYAKKLAENFMGDRHLVLLECISCNEEPASKSCLQRMRSIACTKLRGLEQDRLKITLQQAPCYRQGRKSGQKLSRRNSEGFSADLHDPAIRRELMIFGQD